MVPRLSKILCVGNDPLLTALVSSYHSQPGEYFSVVEAPRLQRPDWENEIARRNNIIAKMKPEKVLLVGLQSNEKAALKKYIPPSMIIEIDDPAQVEERIGQYFKIPNEELVCPKNRIAEGLFLAKKDKKKLRITTQKIEFIPERMILGEGSHLLISEKRNDLAPLVAANYAHSIGSKFLLIPEPTEMSIKDIAEDLYTLYSDSPGLSIGEKMELIKQKIRQLVGDYDFGLASCLTFVTKGIPYGFAFPEFPSAHLNAYPDLGLHLNSSIRVERESQGIRVSLLVDPGFYPESETEDLAQFFKRQRIWVGVLSKDLASVYRVRRFIEYLPYDFLMFTSHAGEISGRRLKIRLQDKKGDAHILTIDLAAGFGIVPGTEMVEVREVSRFVEIDGVDWSDDAKKEKIPRLGEVLEDFAKKDVSQWEIIQAEDIPRVIHSMALKMTDHYLMPAFHALADGGEPIVLNNACCSWYELAGRFIFGGARAYVGTIFDITSAEAVSLTNCLVGKHLGEELAFGLWEAQNEVYRDNPRRPYILIGPHFTTIRPTPLQNAKLYLLTKLREGLIGWSRSKKSLEEQNLKNDRLRNVEEAIKFHKYLFFELAKSGI